MGNPRADKRRPNRDRILSVRLGEAEYERLRRAAAGSGVAPSVLMRAAALDAVDAARLSPSIAPAVDTVPQVPTSELRELRTAVNRVGGNFNQLVRLSSINGALVISEDDEQGAVTALLVELQDLLTEVRQQLGGYRR